MKKLTLALSILFSLNLLASELKMAGENSFIRHNGENVEITLDSGDASIELYNKGVEENGVIDSKDFDDGSGYKKTIYMGFVCKLKYIQNRFLAGRTESIACTLSTDGKGINYRFTDKALLEREGLIE